MHTVDQRRARALQRLSRRDIGKNHEFLDQPVGVEPFGSDHAIDGRMRGEDDLSFGNVEIEGGALVAGVFDRPVGGVERFEDGGEQRASSVVRPAVDRRLRLLVGKFCGRTHQHAMERMRALAAIGTDHDAHGERGTVFLRAQRTQIIGNALRQHWHHAIGEIDRVPAHERLAVERTARPHVMGDIGNGHAEDMAAADLGIGVGRGVDGVVVVLGVGRVDGDERDVAPVLATGKRRRRRGLGLLQRRGREDVRDAVGMDRDQADCALALERAEPLHHARARQSEAAARTRRLDRNQVAVLRIRAGARRNRKLAAELFFVDRREPSAAAGQRAKDAQHARLGAIDDLDDTAAVADRVILGAGLLDAQQRAVTDAGDFARLGSARGLNADFRRRAVRLLVPFGRDRDELAIAVARADVGHHDVRQRARMMQLLAPALDLALVG